MLENFKGTRLFKMTNLGMGYNKIMNITDNDFHNVENKIVDNVLTEQEILQVYNAIENKNGEAFIAPHCQLNLFIQLPENIVDKLTAKAIEASGFPNLELSEYCYARYKKTKNENGKEYKPSLFPHYDETFKEPRFTFDYQLKGTIPWEIVVEDRGLTLKDNQAATFSGTHQIHWRTPTEFSEDDFVDMIFCHFVIPGHGPKSGTLNNEMDAKAEGFKNHFFANGGFTNG